MSNKLPDSATIKWEFEVWFQLETGHYPPMGFRTGNNLAVMEIDKNTKMAKLTKQEPNSFMACDDAIWVPLEYVTLHYR